MVHQENMKKWIKVENIVQEFRLDDETYRRIMTLLEEELQKGLSRENHEKADIKMFPTYVRALPDGSEEGNFLALDLGGTNFRVLLITLHGEEVVMKSKIYLIPHHIMTGTGIQLFDHIAECIHKFMSEEGILGLRLPLGFTFSFPLKQLGLASAKLATWTKGFNCEGVEGEDVVKLLHDAITRKKDMDVQCVAILNDTVGTLMSCAHSDRNCQIGLILGTGTNACYVEKLKDVETWDGELDEPGEVIVNTEWGAFGNNGVLDFIRTDCDEEVDNASLNHGKQIFEKMISGMYMGEIVRLCIVKLVKEKLLFQGLMTDELATRQRFYTKYVSEIESDDTDEFRHTRQVFEELEIEQYTIEDCRIVQYCCSLVSSRAAYLASAGIATLLNRIDKPDITVAIDGSLYKFHPHFHDLMVEKISQLVNPGIKFKLMLSNDGSGKGAAIVASVAHKEVVEHQMQERRRHLSSSSTSSM